MKFLKKLFYGLVALIMIGCAGILILAFSPDMTKSLSETLYGENGLLSHVGKSAGSDENADGAAQLPQEVADAYRIADGVLAPDQLLGYVAPVRGALHLPDEVSKKNGYRPVNGSGEELGEEQLESLSDQLNAGDTGDGLSFDADFYPFYHMLNDTMQHVYRQIYANALAGNTSFAPVEAVNTAQLKNVFEAVYNDHPELFWLDTGYSCKYKSGGECVEVTLAYNRTAQNLSKSKQEFENAAESILSGARNVSGTKEREKYVHDQLVQKASYSLSAAMNQSAYSALVSGDTVCAGYARAFQYLLQQLQIPCYYCTGYSGEDHAWNIVKLDDGYYNVDVTWDDTDPSTYDYYNKSDAEFVGTHVRTGLSVYLPPCGNQGAGTGLADGTGSPSGLGNEGNTVAGITLNPNPQQPLTWVPRKEEEKRKDTTDARDAGSVVSGGDIYNLNRAGLTADMVQGSLKAYYNNCKKQMVDRGIGQQSFSNVVPKSVLREVERAYSTGDYEAGYATEALKKIEAENLAIQIQVQDLGGNYFRLYHNIYTW
ncbi:MAG: hypothetical protein IJ747_05855 [Lachnospiraceae bacterium]|nr:hypothetical protein [Lachnospiraceae bacterium]